MGEIASKPRPISFIIMTNKKFYEKIFRFLKEGVFSQDGIERCPILAMTDYEKAMGKSGQFVIWEDAFFI